ncbi:OmpH family outer membrane protein [Mangrovivirga cuniculi]|uniref:Outer membrane chaperone Skp n=1 Tax=Mangrovivirga cuniculi TaxID=2715131 RepID=A0A4D7K6C9_9BACT|nr:OmpH family outer membrane protein [Mangrovivirga cuniculi]QCK14968.1 outer membrane chaperone Skp [Mangrovivirga cuniculi]
MKSRDFMKNIFKYSSVLTVALLFFVSCNQQGTSETAEDKESESTTSDVIASDLKVGYVNSDTLTKNYKFYQDVLEELESERTRLERQLESRAQGLQKEFEDYQKSAQNLTMGQARNIEENLQRKQQNLMMQRENFAQTLRKTEADKTKEVVDKINEFIESYSKENGYHIILKYESVWYSDERMNITNDVVEGLNASYDAEKNAPEEAESTSEQDSIK